MLEWFKLCRAHRRCVRHGAPSDAYRLTVRYKIAPGSPGSFSVIQRHNHICKPNADSLNCGAEEDEHCTDLEQTGFLLAASSDVWVAPGLDLCILE